MSDGVVLHNPGRYPVDAARLSQASLAVLAAHPERQDGGLTIVISDSRTLASLNSSYSRVDAPTDVLAFPAAVAPDELGENGLYLGDIVIAYDYAAAQAQELEAALSDVLCLPGL